MSFNHNRGRDSGSSRPRRTQEFSGFSRSSSSSSRSRRQKPTKFLDTSLYTREAQSKNTVVETNTDNFVDYNLRKEILTSLVNRGFKSPTNIQSRAIPVILEGQDLVAISQTGSGKTGSFLIPLLNKTKEKMAEGKSFKTLIITPTRELAFQIEKELREFDLRNLGIFSLLCIGGTSLHEQIFKLRKLNHFVIGTPGRILDLANKKALNLSQMDVVVLDEMDRMMEMGFIEDITTIVEQIPANRQALFFSATLNKSVLPVLQKLSPKAVYVESDKPEPSRYVDQTSIRVQHSRHKMEAVSNLLQDEEIIKALIFVNTKEMAEVIAKELSDQNFVTDFLHGGKTQGSRLRTLTTFKKLKKAILVATDVAARGLDVDDISHVINYDEPKTYEDYIHRIGRTGRAGRYGKAITLITR